MRSRLLQVSVLLGFVLNLVVAPIQVLIPLFVRDIKHAAVGYFGVMVAGLLASAKLPDGGVATGFVARYVAIARP